MQAPEAFAGAAADKRTARAATLAVCPRCRGALEPAPAALTCAACNRRYPCVDGVARFVANDSFYEGAYQATINFIPDDRWSSRAALYLLGTHYLWWVRRSVAPSGRLLEMGAGGGVRFFAQHARVTAVDLSFESLRHVDERYELALQADALQLPVPDGSYDGVASAYFYEHIAPRDKPQLLAEIRRVLRPGGRAVMLFDVASANPLFRWLRRRPELFEKCFVEHDHHYGLEPASVNLERFEASGFRVVGHHIANKTPLQHLPVYVWAKPYDTVATGLLAAGAEAISSNRYLAQGYSLGLTVLDDLLEPLFPMDWGRIMLVALERR